MDQGSKSPISINLGKEIDRSLADIMTALLKPPATEIGNLVSDGIGLISDRVRRKRDLNAQLGMIEVRKNLEAASIDLNEISPPKEEEIHLLVNGLSLTDDEDLRSLWAGLFAQALDPDSEVTAERPLISILQTLSPTDAKIIHFLVFARRVDQEWRRGIDNYLPKNLSDPTPEEKQRMEEKNTKNRGLRDTAIRVILDKARAYGLDNINGGHWSENLMRLGIIEHSAEVRRPSERMSVSTLTERDLARVLEFYNSHINYLSQQEKLKTILPETFIIPPNGYDDIKIMVQLTDFGKRFSLACGVEVGLGHNAASV